MAVAWPHTEGRYECGRKEKIDLIYAWIVKRKKESVSHMVCNTTTQFHLLASYGYAKTYEDANKLPPSEVVFMEWPALKTTTLIWLAFLLSLAMLL